jgi:hypothetical protein
MTRLDPALQAHKDWIGFVKPVGLVVSPRALIDGQAQVDVRSAMVPQQILLGLTGENHVRINDFPRFTTEVLGWRGNDLVSGADLESLAFVLTDFGDTLTPSYGVRDVEDPERWLLLVMETSAGEDLDDQRVNAMRGWKASHQARFERLLREREIPIGILTNREVIRLVYRPRVESTGHVTFVIRDMGEVPGRPILAALLLLLGEQRLFALPSSQRLPAILRQSRKFQNDVSERLAEQVLESLWRLLYGFQAADELSRGELLREVLADSPDDVYGGLLATIMRMVFTLYAEDHALLPVDSEIYYANYGLLGLFERLREDNARYADTMSQRFGAWAQLLTLFRLLHDGASHGAFHLPPRQGRLFDPDAYPFMEGRRARPDLIRETESPVEIQENQQLGVRRDDPLHAEGGTVNRQTPRISDAVVYEILNKLLYLDGERLSYAALDVEEIGSVYEAMMGFRVEVTTGRSIGVKPKTKKGVRADVIVDLESLLRIKPQERAKFLKENASAEVSGKSLEMLKAATTPEQLVDALGNRVSPFTQRILPTGTMSLQPSEERRRSGSHYTPRSLTQPIVKTTLQPILDQLCGDPQCAAFEGRNDPKRRDPVPGCIALEGERARHRSPLPNQILDLKVCDPAMGSGAFLVEACRFLGDALVASWQLYGGVPAIPPDEEIFLYARRRIAQECLYGVDRNPFAVDLAKLSLWLATLAKDHPFTFLDHALRHGDSLVGLSRDQILHFDWEESDQLVLELSQKLKESLVEAEAKRRRIHELSDSDDTEEKQRLLADAEAATRLVRTAGDLLIAAFFSAEKDRDRKALRASTLADLRNAIRLGTPIGERAVRELRSGAQPLPPFHWFLEFPEVFSRPNAGFDALVGNPPFAGKNTLIKSNLIGYLAWLKDVTNPGSSGSADLVAYFFVRAFDLLRQRGCLGLVATNTISEGDTRKSGLGILTARAADIYAATKSTKWPGAAAVTVSVIHLSKGPVSMHKMLDGRAVARITRFLFHTGPDAEPAILNENVGRSFKGCELGSLGFLLPSNATIPPELRDSKDLIKPYVGGEDLTTESAPVSASRLIVDVDLLGVDAMAARPALSRWLLTRLDFPEDSKSEWWHFRRPSLEFRNYAATHSTILAISEVTTHLAFDLLPTSIVPSHKLKLFGFDTHAAFACVQSRTHEFWVRLLTSSREARLNYSPTDCFVNFPLPRDMELSLRLQVLGTEYQRFRAELMLRNAEGLTKTYNRFHHPHEHDPDILKLRELHDAMDRAVLDAYGWTDIQPRCEFIHDYGDEEEGASESERKRPQRYQWPNDIRDEVLSRLLALNAERAKQQQFVGAASSPRMKVKSKKTVAFPLFEHKAPVQWPATAYLADLAWARPGTDEDSEEKAMFIAILKTLPGPTSARTVRLAQLFAMEPWLLLYQLPDPVGAEWKRLVGDEAIAPVGVQPYARPAWGRTLAELRARDRLIPSKNDEIWQAGAGLDKVDTSGWPDGRAELILKAIAQRDAGDLVSSLPAAAREWVDVAA